MKRNLRQSFFYVLIIVLMLINSSCQPDRNYQPESDLQEDIFQEEPKPQEQPVNLEPVIIFNNMNTNTVSEFPPIPPTFTLTESWHITSIVVMHWNHAKGAEPGEITILNDQENVFGTWQAEGVTPNPQFPNTYWHVKPDRVLEPGTYIIYDSDPATLSYNAESGNMGMVRIIGFPVGGTLNTEGIDGIESIDSDQPEEAADSIANNDDFPESADENYTMRRIASAETTPESVEGIAGDTPTSLSLSDGTQLDLPAIAGEITVRLSRESTTIQLNQPGFETSGSTRVIKFELDQLDADFIPRLTIPAQEMGELDPATVNIVRVGPRWVGGKILQDQITFMPLTLDSNGDIVIIDNHIASLAAAKTAFNPSAGPKMAALPQQYGTGNYQTAKYVAMTFQANLDWSVAPLMVRMIPDANSPGYRRPADLSRDKEVLEKPITNVITLVHGHNEQEKGGYVPATAAKPWRYAYKQEVWNEFYKAFLKDYKTQRDCTAFYEFIYPSFRPIITPIVGNPVKPLGDSFALAMQFGAENDGFQIERMREAEMPVNVYILAHSQGGLVARAGLQAGFNNFIKKSFRRLVTWGTPHHGSPLVTLGYLFRGGYVVNSGQIPAAHWIEGVANKVLGTKMLDWIEDVMLQVDTPGSRDLRWDNVEPLRLNEIFSADTKALIVKDPGDRYYNLTDGQLLYNTNLKNFNDKDRYAQSDKYAFFFGATSKRVPEVYSLKALGATVLPTLLKDPQKDVYYSEGRMAQSENDCAVPLFSMAGVGISTSENRYYLGDYDHEEYFSEDGKGLILALTTMSKGFGLNKPSSACAKVKIKLGSDCVNDWTCTISASVMQDSNPFPGKVIQSAQAITYQKGFPDDFEILVDLKVNQTGEMVGIYNIQEEYELMPMVVRVVLRDGTKLDSDLVSIYR